MGGNKLYIYTHFVNCETLAAPIGIFFLEARASYLYVEKAQGSNLKSQLPRLGKTPKALKWMNMCASQGDFFSFIGVISCLKDFHFLRGLILQMGICTTILQPKIFQREFIVLEDTFSSMPRIKSSV